MSIPPQNAARAHQIHTVAVFPCFPTPNTQDIHTLLATIHATNTAAQAEKAGVDAELLRLQRLVQNFQERMAQVRRGPCVGWVKRPRLRVCMKPAHAHASLPTEPQ